MPRTLSAQFGERGSGRCWKSSKGEQQVLLKIAGLDLSMYSKMKERLLGAGQQHAHLLPATGPGLYHDTRV